MHMEGTLAENALAASPRMLLLLYLAWGEVRCPDPILGSDQAGSQAA